MKKTLIAAATLATAMLAAGPAHAGDMDLPPDLRPSTFDVSVGVFGVGSSMKTSIDEEPTGFDYDLDGTAYGAGLRMGVDYSSGSWLVGMVGDWSFGGQAAENDRYRAKLEMMDLGTLRLRAGGTYGNALLYMTGGLAQARMNISADLGDDKDQSEWAKGWTVGAGVDYAVTKSISLGLEYLYVKLDDMNYKIEAGTDTYSFDQDLEAIHSIRVGVNYAFHI